MQPTPSTLWLTGLSAAGKTTLALAVAETLTSRGLPCRVLDGGALRQQLCADLGFSRADRSEHARRVAQWCAQMNNTGTWAVAALISPYREDRERARQIVGASRFFEVHVATSLPVCESRDPKGLYRMARAGTIANLTGVGEPYEPPLHPQLMVDTGVQSVEECVAQALALLGMQESVAA
ncbi:putative adenylyl-sulfate kinase [Ralstonia sp. LMG 32965]|uniref:adenylyl-sulfate kinase n=1 Tax=Ralstonia flatus TaxID=3058601 RepID=UPI0028F5451A|nr:adenylyl-sulfate kinase [Ralstonia sp. LMG 32965]CAJ0857188.1 putative adenylyl-sulfate kinase [Ralstonia sp. LMG 32965]